MPSDAERDGLRPGPLEPSAPLSPAPRLDLPSAAAGREAPAARSRRRGRPAAPPQPSTAPVRTRGRGRRTRATAQWAETVKRVAGAGTPVPRQSFWRRWWKAGVVGVVCVLVVVVGLSLPGEEGETGPPPRNARTVAAVDLGMWDCLVTQELLELSPADSRTVGEVTVADCGGPHGGEVFSRMSLVGTAAENEDGTFRGAAQAEDAARAACAEEFAEGMTDPYSHDFTVRVIHPASSEEWTVRQSAACWVSARGLPEYCLVCETKLTDDQEAFRRALVPYTRAWAGRPPEDASLGARRAWASTMGRGIEEAAWLLRGKPELRRLGPEAGADLADALTAQIPYWREAAAAKDPEAHEKAVTEAELAHSAGGEVARARDLIGLAPVITE